MTDNPQSKLPRLIRCYRLLWRVWKERRFQRFIRTIGPEPADYLLDIGGYPFNWFGRGGAVGRVDVLNLELAPITNSPPASPILRAISADARKLPFPDRTYDIVFSNSVIEHVGGPEDQLAFANEARRVGNRLWIQTPAMECPVEPHYLALFIHWLPPSWHAPLARWFSLRGLTGAATAENLRSIAAHTRLLTKREMATLFPDCEIWTERLLWFLPKSHVAIRLQRPGKVDSHTHSDATLGHHS